MSIVPYHRAPRAVLQGRNFGLKSWGTNSGGEKVAPLTNQTKCEFSVGVRGQKRFWCNFASDDSKFFACVLKSGVYGTLVQKVGYRLRCAVLSARVDPVPHRQTRTKKKMKKKSS